MPILGHTCGGSPERLPSATTRRPVPTRAKPLFEWWGLWRLLENLRRLSRGAGPYSGPARPSPPSGFASSRRPSPRGYFRELPTPARTIGELCGSLGGVGSTVSRGTPVDRNRLQARVRPWTFASPAGSFVVCSRARLRKGENLWGCDADFWKLIGRIGCLLPGGGRNERGERMREVRADSACPLLNVSDHHPSAKIDGPLRTLTLLECRRRCTFT